MREAIFKGNTLVTMPWGSSYGGVMQSAHLTALDRALTLRIEPESKIGLFAVVACNHRNYERRLSMLGC